MEGGTSFNVSSQVSRWFLFAPENENYLIHVFDREFLVLVPNKAEGFGLFFWGGAGGVVLLELTMFRLRFGFGPCFPFRHVSNSNHDRF